MYIELYQKTGSKKPLEILNVSRSFCSGIILVKNFVTLKCTQ